MKVQDRTVIVKYLERELDFHRTRLRAELKARDEDRRAREKQNDKEDGKHLR